MSIDAKTDERLYARTTAEAHLYMDLHPCKCGSIEFDRQSAVTTEAGVLYSRYSGPCHACSTVRMFRFELPEAIRPIGSSVDFGGDDPSRLIDPGEWLAVADALVARHPGTRDELDLARAAVEEILKFIPPGADRVPEDAFFHEPGRALHAKDPARFRRDRLASVLAAYREVLATMPEATADGTAEAPPPAAAPAPAANKPLDEYPLQTLVEALANVLAKQQGFQGTELRRWVSDIQGQVQSLVSLLQIKAEEEQQRQQTTAEVEQLIEGIAKNGTSAGRAIAEHRDTIAQAFRGVDLTKIADGLSVLSSWMRNPADDKAGQVQDLIANLERTMGAFAGIDPELREQQRREQIHKEARERVEQIFRSNEAKNKQK